MKLHHSDEWKRRMASRLGLSIEELDKKLSRVILDDQSTYLARSIVDKNGKVVSLLRFPGGYRRVH